MKRTLLLLPVVFVCLITHCYAQKLEVNQVDDFTKKINKATSWETFTSDLAMNSHFRMSLVDTSAVLNLKIMLGKVFSIDKDAQLLLKLENGDIVTLANYQSTITCTGCGATGLNGSGTEGLLVYYPVPQDKLSKLKASKITKIRLYTIDGIIDEDIKDKNAEKLIASINLL